MREYFIPNCRHKNTVYLKSNAQIYCIPKNPGRPWSLNFRVIWRLAWGFGLPGFKGQLLPQGFSLPSSCTSSSQAYLVNVFRRRIRAKEMARTTWPEMHWLRGIMRPRDSARLLPHTTKSPYRTNHFLERNRWAGAKSTMTPTLRAESRSRAPSQIPGNQSTRLTPIHWTYPFIHL